MSQSTISARRQIGVQIHKSIRKSKYKESEILKKEFSDILGIIIDPVKDTPIIPTTSTDRVEISESDEDLLLFYPEDPHYNSRGIAAHLYHNIKDFYFKGLEKLYEWSDMYEIHFWSWGLTDVWTTGDLTVLALSIHSCSATNNEILTTEFMALYRLALAAWRTNESTHREIEIEMMEKQSSQSSASQPVSRRLPIRLISIHNDNIRILNTVITEEYLLSFKKDSPPSFSKLHVHIKSISIAGYNFTQMKDLAKELLNTKEQVGLSDATHIFPCAG